MGSVQGEQMESGPVEAVGWRGGALVTDKDDEKDQDEEAGKEKAKL